MGQGRSPAEGSEGEGHSLGGGCRGESPMRRIFKGERS